MSTVFVTGGTGLTGANVCEQLIARGDDVTALVRNPDEAAALAAIGVELVQGDITDADDVVRAAKGCEAAIHCAALLGGASQDLDDFRAVNFTGTTNVLDAGRAHGMRRVVALSTSTFFDLTGPGFREDAPVLDDPPDDPYTVTKLAAFREVHRRADGGRGRPDLSPRRDLRARPGRRARVAPHQLQPGAAGRHARADLGVPRLPGDLGRRRRRGLRVHRRARQGRRRAPGTGSSGRPEDEISTAAGCNRACEIAGVDHRVEDLDHRTAPKEIVDAFGPDAVCDRRGRRQRGPAAPRPADNPTARPARLRPDEPR